MEFNKFMEIVTTNIKEVDKVTKFRAKLNDGRTKVIRLWKTGNYGAIYYVARGRRNYGFMAGESYANGIAKLSPVKEEMNDWVYRKRFIKAYNMLQKSGLWQNFLAPLKAVIEMSDEDFKEMREMALGKSPFNLWESIYKGGKFSYLSAFSGDMIYSFFQKRCFVTPNWRHHSIIKREVIAAVANKTNYSESWQMGYDNSIELKFDKEYGARGWYSEEYRGCGNGHYYLLFDATHAIFCEND